MSYTAVDPDIKDVKPVLYRLSQIDLDGTLHVHDDWVVVSRNLLEKKVYKKYTILGQEISFDPRGLVLIQYEDGTIEKRYE